MFYIVLLHYICKRNLNVLLIKYFTIMKNVLFTPSGNFEPGFYTLNGFDFENKCFKYSLNPDSAYILNMPEDFHQINWKFQPKNSELKQAKCSNVFTKSLVCKF